MTLSSTLLHKTGHKSVVEQTNPWKTDNRPLENTMSVSTVTLIQFLSVLTCLTTDKKTVPAFILFRILCLSIAVVESRWGNLTRPFVLKQRIIASAALSR
jgi:hypothetical protein